MFSYAVVCFLCVVCCSSRWLVRNWVRHRRKGWRLEGGDGFFAKHMDGVLRQRGHAMENLERGDFSTLIQGHDALLKSPTKRGPAWADVEAATTAVEIKPVRMESLLDACGIDNGDFERGK